jgi:hypothetical protein
MYGGGAGQRNHFIPGICYKTKIIEKYFFKNISESIYEVWKGSWKANPVFQWTTSFHLLANELMN